MNGMQQVYTYQKYLALKEAESSQQEVSIDNTTCV
jgi:hypothetical protein